MPIIDFNNECSLCGSTYGIKACVVCGVRYCKDCREIVYKSENGKQACYHDNYAWLIDEDFDFCYQFGD